MNPGDIFWVNLPPSPGHEQVGRRPAIVLQDDNFAPDLPLVIVVPLTSAPNATRFSGTLSIQPDRANQLSRPSVALVFQIRAVDRRIISDRIGSIDPSQLVEIYRILDDLTGRSRIETV